MADGVTIEIVTRAEEDASAPPERPPAPSEPVPRPEPAAPPRPGPAPAPDRTPRQERLAEADRDRQRLREPAPDPVRQRQPDARAQAESREAARPPAPQPVPRPEPAPPPAGRGEGQASAPALRAEPLTRRQEREAGDVPEARPVPAARTAPPPGPERPDVPPQMAPGPPFAGRPPEAAPARPGPPRDLRAQLSEAHDAAASRRGAFASGVQRMVKAIGPVGFAFAAAEVSARVVAGGLNSARQAVEGMGAAARDFAANNHMAVFSRGVEGAAGALEKIPIAGHVLGAGLRLAAAPVKAFADVVEGFVERGRQLSAYSPDLAASGARAEVASLLADIREAQELGPSLSRLEDASTQMWRELREQLLPIKKWLTEALADIMEYIRDTVRDIDLKLKAITAALDAVSDAQAAFRGGDWAKVMRIQQSLEEKVTDLADEAKERARRRAEEEDAMQMEQLMAGLFDTRPAAVPAAPDPVLLGRPPDPRGAF